MRSLDCNCKVTQSVLTKIWSVFAQASIPDQEGKGHLHPLQVVAKSGSAEIRANTIT